MAKIINVYTMENCPKCKILKESLLKTGIMTNNEYDVKFITINPEDKKDPNLNLLIENGYFMLPVLLVNDTFMNFTQAMEFIKNEI